MKNFITILSLAFAIFSCESRREGSTAALESTLESIAPDSTTAFRELEEEIFSRTVDPDLTKGDTVVYTDSIPVMGDTLSWKIVKRYVIANESLEEFSTDTLIKMYRQKVLYLKDNRQDWYELPVDSRYRATGVQTVCFIAKDKLKRRPDGMYEIRTRRFVEARQLCTAERFITQPVAGFCSGFAVGQRLIVTAGHCIETTEDLASFYILFNFRQDGINVSRLVFRPEEVYVPVEIVNRKLNDSGEDYAVLRVDHDIAEENIAPVRITDVALNEPLFVAGYPCGLPLKIADDAKVVHNAHAKYFLADLDTYGGNSGSPVYDTAHQVVGILVRGARDFLYNFDDNCRYSNVCSSVGISGCDGEGISRTSQFTQYIGSSFIVSASHEKP